MLVGAGLAALGYLVKGLRKDKHRHSPIGPVCDCGHPLSFHGETTRRCHAQTRQAVSDRKLLRANGQCPCQRYVGPEPLMSVWVPPISGSED